MTTHSRKAEGQPEEHSPRSKRRAQGDPAMQAACAEGEGANHRDMVLYGDYSGCLKGIGAETAGEGLPLRLLAVSDCDAMEDVPKVRVWAIGEGGSPKYWEEKGSEAQAAKALEGAWLPQIIADELYQRMLEEGEDCLPVGEFLEEACNQGGDSLLVAEVSLLRTRVCAFCTTLESKRKTSQRVIRRFFFDQVRVRSRRAIARAFILDCMTPDRAIHAPFEELSATLYEDKVVDCSKAMLHRLIQLANWGSKGKPLIAGTVNVKVFLAAYMITSRPNQMFDRIGDLERALFEAGEALLPVFHETARAVAGGAEWKVLRTTVAKDIPKLLCTYLRSFKTWKLADEKKLAWRLTRALRGLEDAEMGLAEGTENDGFRAELRAQQVRLREKLTQIAGERVLQEHDAQRQGQTGVRGARVSRNACAPEPVAAPEVGGMTNEQLAHALLLDADFHLDEKAGMSDDKLVHNKIREVFARAFWESLVEDLSSTTPTFCRVLSVLTEIRTGIAALSQGQPEEAMINTAVDMDAITARLRQATPDYSDYVPMVDAIVEIILRIHSRMRCPGRVNETTDLWQPVRAAVLDADPAEPLSHARALCAALELIMGRLHIIRVDTANKKLRAIAPVIRQHGVQYEKSHFLKRLAAGTLTLQRTTDWITHSLAIIHGSQEPVVTIDDLLIGRPGDFEAVLYSAMVDLIADYPNWGGVTRTGAGEDLVPETMRLDTLHIRALNMHFQTDIASAIVLTTVEMQCQSIPDPVARAEAFAKVQEAILANPPRLRSLSATIRLVALSLQDVMTAPQLEACQRMLDTNLGLDSAVRTAMAKIFKQVWYHLVKDGELPASCNIPGCTHPLLPGVMKNSASLATIVKHSSKVHSDRYNSIISRAGSQLRRARDVE